MIYSLPYILMVVVIGLAALYYQYEEREDYRRYTLWGVVALMFFFFAFRGYVSTDWTAYYADYQKCELENVWNNVYTSTKVLWRIEPGFTLLMWLCKMMVPNYIFLNVVCTAVNLVLLLRFLRRRLDNPVLGLLLFTCFGGLMLSINLMRNAISILIFVNTLHYIRQRRPLPFFLWNLLGMMFHISAVFFLPCYFFLHRSTNKWVFAAVFVVGNIIFLGRIPIFLSVANLVLGDAGGHLATVIENYTSGQMEEAAGISIGYLERLLTATLVWLYYDRLLEVRKDNMLFINSYLIYASLFFYFSEFRVLSLRFSYLFFFSYWILWADLPRCFALKNNRYLFIGFVALYCVLKTHGQMNNIVSEYDNMLLGGRSYEERLYIFNRNYDD